MKKTQFLSMIMLFFVVNPLWAETRIVPDEYNTIQMAINDCNDGDIVIVNPGTYIENINFLGKNVTVTSIEPENWDVVETTIIDGNNSGSVITFDKGETNEAILTGFTITHGYGSKNYEIGENSEQVNWGSGIFCNNSSPSILNNIITDNSGPIDTESGHYSYGIGISCYLSNAIISRNLIKNNSGFAGGGIMTYYCDAIITNNIICDNSASIGGGVVLLGGSLINNTIINNDADISDENNAGNIYASSQSNIYKSKIINNIICNAKSGNGIYAYGIWDDLNFTHNNVWGNLPDNYADISNMTGMHGNISADPQFVDLYHIETDSPCYNSGDPNYIPYLWQRDIDGEYAVMGSCIEIGADEITGNARPVANAGDDQHSFTMVSNVILDGTGSLDPDNSGVLTYNWTQVGGPDVVLVNPDSPEPNFAPPTESVYEFELIVYDGNLYSQPDNVTIIVGNRVPIANAGEEQSCQPGEEVYLSGSGSYDLDGNDILSYSWTQVSGPTVELWDANTVSPYFTPGVAGEYVFKLIVSDSVATSLPDTIRIICHFGSEQDDFGYSWIDSDNPWGPAFNWIDISDSRSRIINFSGSLEEVIGTVNLGFSFPFYGKTYNKIYIQSSGMISFGSDPITYSYQQIPQADGYDNIIAWMWTLLYPLDGSEIYFKSIGDYFVIQFVDFTINNNGGIVNAELILYKSGKIVIQYKDFSNKNSLYCTIGIENHDGTIGTQVAYNDRLYLHDKLAIEFSLGGPYEPVAHAGSDIQSKFIELITLDGTGSKDRDLSYVLTYQWAQISGPSVELSDSTSATPTFMPEVDGEYVFQLVVSDGTNTSVPDEVTVIIGNRAPVANAGSNKSCEPNQVVRLDGSGSYDPDINDELSYSWTQISGVDVELSDANIASPNIIPTVFDEYVFELFVSDGLELSQPDTVVVVCGLGSAPDDYGYNWIDNSGQWGPNYEWIDIQNTGTEISGIQNSIEENFGPFPLGFDFNFYGNTYDYFYVQSEGAISFDPQPITYSNMRIPQADGYNNLIAWMWTLMYPLTNSKLYYQHFDGYAVIQFVDYTLYFNNDAVVNAEVILYESGKIKFQYKDISDVDDIYQYTIGIENADGTIGTLVAYNKYNYLYDNMVIEFSTGSYLPTANAGKDQYISRSSLVTLDGSKSYTYNPSGIKEYHWEQIEGPAVTLSDSNSMHPVFMAESENTYRFELVVSDSIYQSESDEVSIIVHNLVPIAVTGPDQLIQDSLEKVTLNAGASYDLLGDSVTYKWNQISGPVVTLSDSNTAEPNFVPTEFGIYEFELIVSDGELDSAPCIVTIVVDNGFFPVANAGPTIYSEGGNITLNGTGSYDPDNSRGHLIFSWEQISGTPVVLTDSGTATPKISGIVQDDTIQTYEFQLVVSDGEYVSFPDTVEVKIVPEHPDSVLVLESGTFDPNKPTMVYYGGGDGVSGGGSWPYTSGWTSKANTICFTSYGPDSTSGSRRYYHCGDMLICYLSQVAPHYNKAIQTMGWSTGGQPAMDTGIRINLTYKDARYAINRVTLLDECCRDFSSDVKNFTSNPVDGEQSWVDKFYGSMGSHYPGSLYVHVAEGDHGAPPTWYRESISNSDMNVFNGGLVAGSYYSVVGPGKNFQLSRSHVNDLIYKFRWYGDTSSGYMDYYDETTFRGKMLAPVTLAEPYGEVDSNGIYLNCLECENAAGYQVLVGTDPDRVMDFKIVSDTPEPPDTLVTELPAEQSWWTVRAYDIYDSNIYADPQPLNLSNFDFQVVNVTSKTKHLTIQNAISKASSGDTIIIEPGVYLENIDYLDKNIKILSSDPNDPAVVATTIIASENDSPAVTISGIHDSNCMLSGITITGSNIGIYCSEFSSPVITKCKIMGNALHGINLYSGCEPKINNCEIMNNAGCGINMELTIGRTKYENYPIITNCVISRNAQYAVSKGKPTISNCTIVDNLQIGLYKTEANVTNSIIYFNGDGTSAAQVSGGNNTITFSDIQGSASGVGNIAADPLFADSMNSDYHLASQTGRWDPVNLIWVQDASSSPCLDAGNPATSIGFEPAPNGSVINIGAYGGTNCASMSP